MRLAPVPAFTVVSSDLAEGGSVGLAQLSNLLGAGSGGDSSPQLAWSGFPRATKSFAVTAFDADAPTPSGFWHWAVSDIPAHVTSLPTGSGASGGERLPRGAVQLRNDLSLESFVGFAPDIGSGDHRVVFAVHALSVKRTGVDATSTAALLHLRMNNHTLARAVLTATVAIGTTGRFGDGFSAARS